MLTQIRHSTIIALTAISNGLFARQTNQANKPTPTKNSNSFQNHLVCPNSGPLSLSLFLSIGLFIAIEQCNSVEILLGTDN